MIQNEWLAVSMGNSRWHWGRFAGDRLADTWDSDRASARTMRDLRTYQHKGLPIVIASVVPEDVALWRTVPQVDILSIDRIPLRGLYPTHGLDRALALWGAGMQAGFPALVIDAGTALTVTASDADGTAIGGSITPGISLQMRALASGTAALPQVALPKTPPPRLARSTIEAIQSGVLYTAIAGLRETIEVWRSRCPGRRHIWLTGGDGAALMNYLRTMAPDLAASVRYEPNLVLLGMCELLRAGRSPLVSLDPVSPHA